jgi:hypothetical protein
MTADIREFLIEQWAAEEAAARGAHGGWGPHAWDFDPEHREVRYGQITIYGERVPHGYHTTTAAHLAMHDPARILAEVAAKRRILELHAPIPSGKFSDGSPVVRCHNGCGSSPCDTVRLLAAPYRSEPAFDPPMGGHMKVSINAGGREVTIECDDTNTSPKDVAAETLAVWHATAGAPEVTR